MIMRMSLLAGSHSAWSIYIYTLNYIVSAKALVHPTNMTTKIAKNKGKKEKNRVCGMLYAQTD